MRGDIYFVDFEPSVGAEIKNKTASCNRLSGPENIADFPFHTKTQRREGG